MYKTKRDIFLRLIIFLIFMTNFNNSPKEEYKIIGAFSILLIMGISFMLFITSFNKIKIGGYNTYVYLFMCFILLIYVAGISNYITLESIITSIKISLLFIFCIVLSSFNFERYNYIKVLKIGLYLYLLIFGVEILKYGNTESVGVNTASLSFIICIYFCLLIYIKTKKLKNLVIAILFFIFIIINRARTSMLVIMVSITVYFCWSIVTKYKFIYRLFIVLFLIMIFVFIYLYTYSDDIKVFVSLNEFSREYFNKNFNSGRNTIWKELFEYINKRPFWGYGSGMSAENISANFSKSTHSFYMQVLLQVGWLGMILWCLLFYSIWDMFWHTKNNKITRLSASFFVGILVQNIFELTFYSNKISIGIMQWLIIAVGISRAGKTDMIKNEKNNLK